MSSRDRTPWGGKPVVHRFRDPLSQIGWQDFERLLVDYYRDQGYEVEHCGTGSGAARFDGGVDLRLRRDGKLTLVQCKHENANQVTHNVVHQLLGVKVNEEADAAIVVTSGEFTAAALRAGEKGHVQLIDGVALRRLLGDRLVRLQPTPSATPPGRLESVDWQQIVVDPSRSPSPRGRRGRSDSQQIVVKLITGLILLLLLIFVVPAILPKLFLSMLPGPQVQRTAPAAPAVASTPYIPSTSAPAPVPEGSRPPTARELEEAKAEQARREAEVQQYLQRVPELSDYRYPPPNRTPEPPPDADQH